MPRKKEGRNRERNPEALGISGFTLGIVSLVMLVFSSAMGVITSIVGFFFCLFQQKKKNTRMARKGLVINIIGFVLNVAWWIVYALVVYPVLQQSIGTVITP